MTSMIRGFRFCQQATSAPGEEALENCDLDPTKPLCLSYPLVLKRNARSEVICKPVGLILIALTNL